MLEGDMGTAKTLDDRLDDLVHEIKEIKKELLREKITRPGLVKEKSAAWISLRKKVSARWDTVSAVDEIADQREKGRNQARRLEWQ
jgi:HD superfamily phosphodiesterase